MIYYYGRGSSNCIAIEPVPPFSFRIFIGNGKSGEMGVPFTADNWEMTRLADFFRAVSEKHGHEMYTERLHDDPHDEILHHTLDLEQVE